MHNENYSLSNILMLCILQDNSEPYLKVFSDIDDNIYNS